MRGEIRAEVKEAIRWMIRSISLNGHFFISPSIFTRLVKLDKIENNFFYKSNPSTTLRPHSSSLLHSFTYLFTHSSTPSLTYSLLPPSTHFPTPHPSPPLLHIYISPFLPPLLSHTQTPPTNHHPIYQPLPHLPTITPSTNHHPTYQPSPHLPTITPPIHPPGGGLAAKLCWRLAKRFSEASVSSCALAQNDSCPMSLTFNCE